MSDKRRSIDIESFGHKNPIPAASIKGNILMSGAIGGMESKPTARNSTSLARNGQL